LSTVHGLTCKVEAGWRAGAGAGHDERQVSPEGRKKVHKRETAQTRGSEQNVVKRTEAGGESS
jgi:hypothetical protein